MTPGDLWHASAQRLRRSLLAGAVNVSLPIKIAGRRFQIPYLGGHIAWPSEAWMAPLLALILRDRAGSMFDVGANLGQTLLKLRAIDDARPYIGFEPNPVCVAYLRRLIRVNHFAHCTVYPAAIGPAAGTVMLDLYGSETNTGASIVSHFRDESLVTGRVPVVKLSERELPDTIRNGPIALVKIDVEGAEVGVMQGLAESLCRHRPAVLIEVLPVRDDPARRVQMDALQNIVRDMNYTIHHVVKTGSNSPALKAIDHFHANPDLSECDYVLLP